jgi:hypothetical protein
MQRRGQLREHKSILSKDQLSFHLEANNLNSFDFNNSTGWHDIKGGLTANFSPSLANWNKIEAEKAIENNANGEFLSLNNPYSIGNAEEFTLGVYFKYSGGNKNAGFIRSANNYDKIWILQNGTTRRLWVRIGGIDIFKPSTGFQWSSTEYTYMTVAIKQDYLSICFDGVEQYNTTTGRLIPSTSVNDLMFNVSNENILGKWRSFHLYRRAITPEESLYNYNSLTNYYQ